MKIVLRVGGSVIASPVNIELIKKYAEIINFLGQKENEMAVVVGGGALAREFIEIAKKLGLETKDQDELAILVSRLYAQLLAKKLGGTCCQKIPLTIEEAVKCLRKGKIAVLGGLKPGMTTDTVAAILADHIKADLLIKATDQEGVYNKDPRKHPDAVKLDKLNFEDLSKVLAQDSHIAGIHQILDPEAVRVLRVKRLKVVVLNGFKPENILAAAEGKNIGTVIE
jgi:uridylate kinase